MKPKTKFRKPTFGPPPSAGLDVTIYQIADDAMFVGHRPDGTGFDWGWADWRREWMDNTQSKFAYRCLPITIANQTGWWVSNPVGFTAIWNGRPEPGAVQIMFDSDPVTWNGWINNQFGLGVVTWNTPFLWRTRPQGSRLFVSGPINSFKHGIQPLGAIIESDWMNMSFTMNWKLTAPGIPVRFDQGEPILQAIPIGVNIGDQLESANVRYMKLAEDREVFDAYHKWHVARSKFHELKRTGEVGQNDWQKDYFQGKDIFGREVASGHKTKLTPPKIEFKSAKP